MKNKIDVRTIPLIAEEVNQLTDANINTFNREFKRLQKRYENPQAMMREIDEAREVVNSTPYSEYSNMSSSARYAAAHHIENMIAGLGPHLSSSLMLAAMHSLPLYLFIEMCAQCGDSRTQNMLREMLLDTRSGAFNNGNMYAILFPVYQYYGQSASLQFDGDLMKELQMTDLSSSVPVRMLEMPFQHCYIQFGPIGENSVIDKEYIVYNQESGDHVLEGCMLSFHNEKYIFHTELVEEVLGFAPGSDIRGFDVMFLGSPKSNMLDDATQHFTLFYDHDSDEPLIEVINRSMDFHINHQTFDERPEYQNMRKRDGDNMAKNVDLLARCLVYMNCADCRKIDVDEQAPILARLSKSKNEKKRRRMQKQLRQADKYILIKPVARNENIQTAGDSNRSVKAHWRRGHMRMQPYGENRAKKKLIHIRPKLIGVNSLGAVPNKKTYKVR